MTYVTDQFQLCFVLHWQH